jgi:hypothetical protein
MPFSFLGRNRLQVHTEFVDMAFVRINWYLKLENKLLILIPLAHGQKCLDCQTRGHGAVYIKESVLG